MKLRRSIMLSSACITLVLTVGMLAMFHYVLLASYGELERKHLAADMNVMVKFIDNEIRSLDRTVQDYANWDETYAFVERPHDRFAKSEFTLSTMQNLGLRCVLIINLQQRIVFQQSFRRGSSNVELAADIQLLLRAAEQAGGTERDSASGIVALSDGPVLLAVRPILTSDARGPSRGTVLMVRQIDYNLLAKTSSLLELPVRFRDIQRDRIADQALLDQVRGKDNFASRILDPNRVAVFRIMNDMWEVPRFLVRIEHDRDLWNEGKRAERIVIISIAVFGLLFCCLDLFAATRKVIRPLEEITQFTRAVTQDGNLGARLQVRGPQEISEVSTQINSMLNCVQVANQQLVSARERLQYQATHDALTGAWNRAGALELLDRELDRCARENSVVAVILFDADHFKAINDRYGHSAGDAVLQSVTTVIGRNLRSFDTLARYGGEEFVVIAPNCSAREACALAQRILHRLKANPIQVGENVVHITASAGLTSGASPMTAEDLIGIADRAMYRAKENGRDCVEYEEAIDQKSIRNALYAVPRRLV
jgi:diguanylate cyclase (GGDEF)-like protein